MKAIRFGFVSSTLFIACAAFGNDAPPSDASIQELTTLAHSQELFSGMKPQMDAMIASSMKEASQGQTITPERQACKSSWSGFTRLPTPKMKSTG